MLTGMFHKLCSCRRKEADRSGTNPCPPPHVGSYTLPAFQSACELSEPTAQANRLVAIACGGTGGHFFPGLAVAEQLARRGWAVKLLISPKEVDQQATRTTTAFEVVTLPAVALNRGGWIAFLRGFILSYRASRELFKRRRPDAVLAMGGFTSAPPILAGRRAGARTFLHESNTVPGRANRWLARLVNESFVGFPEAAERLRCRKTTVTGTPVRAEFRPRDAAECRAAFGLDPQRPVLLVMGGSQGASGINDLVVKSLRLLCPVAADVRRRVTGPCANPPPYVGGYGSPGSALQFLHFTGASNAEKIRHVYAENNLRAAVQAFGNEMHLALGAATVAISRAGASSLAELAAVQVPAILIPFPAAAGNHQFYNAHAFEKSGAARLLEQKDATAEKIAALLTELVGNATAREKIQAALAKWHTPKAAQDIAEIILNTVARSADSRVRTNSGKGGETREHGCPRSCKPEDGMLGEQQCADTHA